MYSSTLAGPPLGPTITAWQRTTYGYGDAAEHLGLLVGVWGRADGLLEREDLAGAAVAHLDHRREAAPAEVADPVEVRRLP
jgi:hypothetical protein